jgi:hypoxia up-regulated 1
MMRHNVLIALVSLALLLLAQGALAALMAIDLGSENLKVSIVQPSKIPISIVLNEMSKRKTAASVAVVNGERLVGEDAAALAARFPDKVFSGFRDLLGKRYDDTSVISDREQRKLPFEILQAGNRSTVAFRTDGSSGLTVEEAVASLFEYAASLAKESADGVPVTDCVIAVPSYYTPAQRQAIHDAAGLAGLNVLTLVNSHAAAALQYGIERDFGGKHELVIFYDLGAKSAEAALVEFSSFDDGGKQVSQFEVKDVAWVKQNAGGDALEAVIVDLLVEKFVEAGNSKEEVLSNKRAVAKLRKQAQKAKHVLSANTEVGVSIEDLLPDIDLRTQLTREEFEKASVNVIERAVAPLKAILNRNSINVDDLAGVELLGGSSRVPLVKSTLSELLKGRALDAHLDADEAVVMGAGYIAANLSTIFRLRKFGMADKSMHQIDFSIVGDEDSSVDPKIQALVPVMKKVPTIRTVKQDNITADSFSVMLEWNNERGAVLESCKIRESLGDVNVSGIHGVIDKRGFSGRVALHTRMDSGGLFLVDRADAAVEIEVEEKIPKQDSSPDTNQTSIQDSEEDSLESDNEQKDSTAETRVVRKVVKDRLSTNISLYPGIKMTAQDYKSSKKVMKEYRDMDRKKKELAKAKNDLEAYCISKSSALNDEDSQLYEYSTEEERQDALKALADAEDWIYSDDAESSGAAIFRAKLSGVSALVEVIHDRIMEASARPGALKSAKSAADDFLKAVKDWKKNKPWISAEETESVTQNVTEFHAWLSEKEKAQGATPANKDPVFRVSEVLKELELVKKTFTRVNIKSKPIEKSAEEAASNSTKEDAESKDESGDKAEHDSSEDPKERDNSEL